MRSPGPVLELALVLVLCLIWGSTWLVIQEGLEDLPPFTSLSLRFSLAALIFWPLAPRIARREGGARPTWRLILAMGVLVDAVPYAVIYFAEQTLPSGLTCVLWGVYPLLLAASGHYLLPGERLTPASSIGFAGGFVGVALLFATDLREISPEAMRVGALLLVSPVVSVLGHLVLKRYACETSSALLVRDGLIVAALLVWPLALATERPWDVRLTGRAVASFVYLAVLGTVLAFSIYFWLLRHAPATRLALIAYATPAVALLLGWAVRSEPIGPSTLGGTALIVGGVALAGRRRAQPRSGPSIERA